MQKIVELVIIHGKEWLTGVAALMWVALQWKKSSVNTPKTTPAQSSQSVASDQLPPAAAPTANLDKAWRMAAWRATRLDILMLGMATLAAAGQALVTAVVTPSFVFFELFMVFVMLTSWASIQFSIERLRRRWAMGLRD